jgi:predicted PurR-regulated permease PerM
VTADLQPDDVQPDDVQPEDVQPSDVRPEVVPALELHLPRLDRDIPRPFRLASEWAWRGLVIAAAVVAVLLLMNRLKLVFLAVFVALLVSALLIPFERWLEARGLSRGFATGVTLLTSLVVLGGIVALTAFAVSDSFGDIGTKFSDGLGQIRSFLRDTLNIDDTRLQDYLQRAWKAFNADQGSIVSGALSGATIALELLSGAAIAFFATVFFLLDGPGIWAWCVSLFPRDAQADLREVGSRCWVVLTAYVRGTVFIAFTDALFIGLAITIIGVPLALPLSILVFFGAFVPIAGALVTGFVAVVVALATKGVVAALAVLASIIVVQQIEGHLLQPLVMGRLVSVHPLGVVLAVTAGTILAGLVGAVVAVPVAAVVSTVLGYYGRRSRAPAAGPDTA